MIQQPWCQIFSSDFQGTDWGVIKIWDPFWYEPATKKRVCTAVHCSALYIPGGDYKTTGACPAWMVWKCLAREQSDLSFQSWFINQSRAIALPLLIGIGKSTFLALSLSRWLNWKKAVWHLAACFWESCNFPSLLRKLHICVPQLSLRKCAAVQGSHYEF